VALDRKKTFTLSIFRYVIARSLGTSFVAEDDEIPLDIHVHNTRNKIPSEPLIITLPIKCLVLYHEAKKGNVFLACSTKANMGN